MTERKISVREADAWELYLLLEEMNRFLHQPMNYPSSEEVQNWLRSGVNERLGDALYRIAAEWFPVDENSGHVVGPGGALHPPTSNNRK